jgi:hypothetical protein
MPDKRGGTREPIEPTREAEVEVDASAEHAAAPTWTLQLLADKEASWSESRFWRDFAVGHSWARLISPEGDVDSWGYWPDLWSGHGVNPSQPWKSVPGKVLHPDEEHAPNAMLTYKVTAKQAEAAADHGNAREASPGMYNLFSYNCTTFACEMAEAAGQSAPSGATLGIKNPNDLYADIIARNAGLGLDPMGRQVEAQGEGEGQ